MKTYQKLAMMILVSWSLAQAPALLAQSPAAEPEPEAAKAPAAASSKHLKLCAQLGLKVGRTYEFMLTGNEEVHYWQVRSLGENGWFLAKDSRYPATWVNLSQVIAITPLANSPAPAERAKKPNREER